MEWIEPVGGIRHICRSGDNIIGLFCGGFAEVGEPFLFRGDAFRAEQAGEDAGQFFG